MAEAKGAKLYDEAKDNLSKEPYDFPADQGFCLEKSETRAKGRFAGKVIIITGGAGNFGVAMAERMAGEGALIALFDIRDPTETAKAIEEKFGVKVRGYVADVTKEEVVAKAVSDVVTEFGRIDLLFNNAGYQGDFTPTQNYDVGNFRKVLDINVTGVFIVLKAVAKQMIAQDPQGGSIVNTSSMAAHGVPPNMLAYAASKAAVTHLTRVAAKDLAPSNIRVNAVSPALIGPGFMWTRQVELQANAGSSYFSSNPKEVANQMISGPVMKRYGSLAEVMGPVCFLLSDDAGYMTGQDILINGGEL